MIIPANNDIRRVSWDEYHLMVEALGRAIMEEHPDVEGIVAIGRGGFVPATILSHLLQLPIKASVVASSYIGKLHQPRVTLTGKFDLEPGKRYLCIDDIVDSGCTAAAMQLMYPMQLIWAAPIGKPNGIASLHDNNKLFSKMLCYFIPPVIVENETWIVFPWENDLHIEPL